ncbi:replication fork protection component Swi3-domain-containing protein [Podospora australis]|uniref:Chromosome segregation in meiosis protein n=1 Tax=Podospora australis TaxID=1536484 RepID=A0AAN6WZP1_9PEZI|nr:replication fork protection component Swi3-domain-containing protein [Podospora australis]
MPPKSSTTKATKATKASNAPKDPIDDYLLDWGSDSDLGSPKQKQNGDKKRKGDDILGLEKEIDKKKSRIPRVKLDDTRLLSDKGIPKLRKNVSKLKLKGKGHEFSDTARLLSFYQEWLDDLFPKATFLDALAMVEKAGHKTTVRNARIKWIDELKPKGTEEYEPDFAPDVLTMSQQRNESRMAPIFEKAAAGSASQRQRTPERNDGDHLFGDEDLYNATPRAGAAVERAEPIGEDGVPDEDDWDALMAEAETRTAAPVRANTGSIFGNGNEQKDTATSTDVPDEDDLDALMAEAEAETSVPPAPKTITTSIFGDGKPKEAAGRKNTTEDDYDGDLDALMAEAELASQPAATTKVTAGKTAEQDDGDDLDALMAEAEAQSGTTKTAPGKGSKLADPSFDEDEEAMAEMDGLW